MEREQIIDLLKQIIWEIWRRIMSMSVKIRIWRIQVSMRAKGSGSSLVSGIPRIHVSVVYEECEDGKKLRDSEPRKKILGIYQLYWGLLNAVPMQEIEALDFWDLG